MVSFDKNSFVFQPHEDPKLEIKDLVKDAVREYFDALNLPQMIETHRELTNEAAVPQQQYPGSSSEIQLPVTTIRSAIIMLFTAAIF